MSREHTHFSTWEVIFFSQQQTLKMKLYFIYRHLICSTPTSPAPLRERSWWIGSTCAEPSWTWRKSSTLWRRRDLWPGTNSPAWWRHSPRHTGETTTSAELSRAPTEWTTLLLPNHESMHRSQYSILGGRSYQESEIMNKTTHEQFTISCQFTILHYVHFLSIGTISCFKKSLEWMWPISKVFESLRIVKLIP